MPETDDNRGGGQAPPQSKSQKPLGKNYCLLIGIDTYEDAQNIKALSYPVKNITDFKAQLDKNFTGRRVKKEEKSTEWETVNQWEIETLINEEAKLENIDKYFENKERFTADDNLIIYFSGHGYFEYKSNDFQSFFIPYDGITSKKRTLLPWNDIFTNYVGSIPCFHVVIIADACYAGKLHTLAKLTSNPSFSETGLKTTKSHPYNLPSRFLITSGSVEKVPDKSLFADVLIEALEKTAFEIDILHF